MTKKNDKVKSIKPKDDWRQIRREAIEARRVRAGFNRGIGSKWGTANKKYGKLVRIQKDLEAAAKKYKVKLPIV